MTELNSSFYGLSVVLHWLRRVGLSRLFALRNYLQRLGLLRKDDRSLVLLSERRGAAPE